MPNMAKWATMSVGVFVALIAIIWLAMGEDWRRLLSDPPEGTDVLFWSQEQRDTGFRMLDRVPFLVESRVIETDRNVRPLPNGAPLDLGLDLDAYIENNRMVSVVILHNGEIRAEQYSLGFEDDERWTSFSVAKSLTSTLVGAAIVDGYINSVDDPVTDYIPDLAGTPYENVTIAQLLTMTSGVDWNEDYEDPQSDVALFSNHVPQGEQPIIVSYMQSIGQAADPGVRWNYSTGETNLIGILVNQATGKTLTDYLSEKIWVPYGMEADASWLVGTDGQEISGCCIQATTRDFARFGQFILEGAQINGESLVPAGWLDVATQKQAEIGAPGEGYGYQWWTLDDGAFQARGIFGQGIFIDPARNLVIASNGSWRSARGQHDGEAQARLAFYRSVQAAVDREAAR